MRFPAPIVIALCLLGPLVFALASCGSESGSAPGLDGGPSPGENPCSYSSKGDLDDRVELNAHLGLRRRGGLDREKYDLVVTCIHDPPGSQQQGIAPAFEIPFDGPRNYIVDDTTHASGRVVIGNRAGSVVFLLDGSGGERGVCTFSIGTAPSIPAKLGDRVDASFHCEGLETESLGRTYHVDITDGAIGGTLEAIEP